MEMDNLGSIEKFTLNEFILNVKKLVASQQLASREIFGNRAEEDLNVLGNINNYAKILNPNYLRDLYQWLENNEFQRVLQTAHNLSTKTSTLKFY